MNPVHQLPQSPAVSSPKGSLSRLPSNLGKGLRLGTEEKTKQKNEERHKGRQRQREKRAHGTGGTLSPAAFPEPPGPEETQGWISAAPVAGLAPAGLLPSGPSAGHCGQPWEPKALAKLPDRGEESGDGTG